MPKSHLQGAFFVFFFLNLDSGIFAEDAPGSPVDEASWVLDCERNLVVNAPNSKKIIFGDARKLAFNPTSGDIVSDQMARIEAALVDMEALKVSFNAEKAASAATVQKLTTENTDLKQQLAALKTDLDAVKADVADLKPDVSTVKTDVASMKPDLSTMKVDIGSMKPDLSTVKADVATIKPDLSTVKVDVAGVRDDLDAAKGRIATLQGVNADSRIKALETASNNAAVDVVFASDGSFVGTILDGVYLGSLRLDGTQSKAFMDAFISKNITVVNGPLYIEQCRDKTDDGAGLCDDLTFLDSIVACSDGVYIQDNYDGLTTLEGVLPNLASTGGRLQMHNNQNLVSIANAFAKLGGVPRQFQFSSNKAVKSFDNAFGKLASVGDRLVVENNGALVSMDGAFASLRQVRLDVYVYGNTLLTTIKNSFNKVESLADSIIFRQNNALVTVEDSFTSLKSVKNLYVNNNDALESFPGSFEQLVAFTVETTTGLQITGNKQLKSLPNFADGIQFRYYMIWVQHNPNLADFSGLENGECASADPNYPKCELRFWGNDKLTKENLCKVWNSFTGNGLTTKRLYSDSCSVPLFGPKRPSGSSGISYCNKNNFLGSMPGSLDAPC